MLELFFTAAFFVPAFGMFHAYRSYRDPLHPLMFLGPMLMYTYGFLPAALYYQGRLPHYFSSETGLLVAQGYSTAAVVLIVVGCLGSRVPKDAVRSLPQTIGDLSPKIRKGLRIASYFLAGIGLTVFYYKIFLAGGFYEAYSRPKGGGAPISFGYLSEAPLFTIPAVILYLIGNQGRRMTVGGWVLLLLIASPNLLQGTFGGRRGPAFLGIGSLIFGWYLVRAKRPTLKQFLTVLILLGLFLLFVMSERRVLYLGSEEIFQWPSLTELIFTPGEGDASDTTFSLGLINTCWLNEHYLWGKGFVTQIFIRPIPSALWPGKYAALGMDWMLEAPGSMGIPPWEWLQAVGWIPVMGSAPGVAANTFLEFSWGGLVFCFLLGMLYGRLWKNTILRGGVWNIVYFEACVLSVYIPTQGLASAWGYRFVYLVVPTIILWRYISRRYARAAAETPSPQLQQIAGRLR